MHCTRSARALHALCNARGTLTARSRQCSQVDPVWPALATLLLAYFVARAFASVYECVVGTHAKGGLLGSATARQPGLTRRTRLVLGCLSRSRGKPARRRPP